MRLTPTEPNTEDGFTDENDIFGYREFGERLAKLVSSVDEPLVIVLDAPWGSGKSVFIKQWAGMIKKQGGSVAYFDAFRNDIHDNAFLSLASEIHSLAKETLGEDKSEKFLDIAGKVGRALAPVGFRVATRFVTLGLFNSEDIDEADKAFKNVVKALRNEEEQAILEKLRGVDEERTLLENFRNDLWKVSKDISENKQEGEDSIPLIFIVDDLDRCRPPFALDIIERVKHLFSVQNVCFVLVTHLPHLEKIIQSAYGTSFDARIYLEKFYHIRITLPEPKDIHQRQRNKYLDYLWKILKPQFENDSIGQLVREEIRHLVNTHTLSLRQIERALTNIIMFVTAVNTNQISTLAAMSVSTNQISVLPVLAGLCVMRQTHPDLYEQARQNSLSWRRVEQFLVIDSTRRKEELVVKWWRYFVDNNPPQRVMDQCSSVSSNDRLSLLRIFTSYIDSLADDYSRK